MHPHREIIEEILSSEGIDRRGLERLKIEVCRRHALTRIPTNAEILALADEAERTRLLPLLRSKPTRTLSGVAVVAAMTSPAECPHGRCAYCPGGVEAGTPQSYTGREPAAMRASHHLFDPYRQVNARLKQLSAIGHPVDKVDLIVMGGTFTSRPRAYREAFVKGCLDAMNHLTSKDLEEAKTLNEHAQSRCIGLTLETRPDCFNAMDALSLGATRVELGVQTLNDAALGRVGRGHGIAETVTATKAAKDAGLKTGYHMMPGLPGETLESDLRTFRILFEDERFKPDMLKIYPTLVLEDTRLHEAWLRSEYRPYSTEDVVTLLTEVKAFVPPWVRIQRIQRDIPVPLIVDGVRKSHVRMLVSQEMRRRGTRCGCIRCREAGLLGLDARDIALEERSIGYRASGAEEHFMSLEAGEALVAYLRLRITGEGAHSTALGLPSSDRTLLGSVRELKVLGQMLPLSQHPKSEWQHRGLGERLLRWAEEVARHAGAKRMLITSGVGVREYYRRLGYALEGTHMVKVFS
ncbi:MAG: tRNA uridine(34) 5-carboxymethylaminomethyl modification radical SAM/GNAT enzyme Elp3 [Candidatus Thermoplasmatota archaeon]